MKWCRIILFQIFKKKKYVRNYKDTFRAGHSELLLLTFTGLKKSGMFFLNKIQFKIIVIRVGEKMWNKFRIISINILKREKYYQIISLDFVIDTAKFHLYL